MSDVNGAALEVQDLSYAYGPKRALSEVSFRVDSGDCTILLGPNGAGKSTLFSLVTHLFDSREGRVKINGYDVRQHSCEALAKLGVVFQQTTLDPDLSVLQNLHYHAALHGMSRRFASARIQVELERQGMFERRGEKVRQLNGGHRRRVEIARALLHEPALLLLDEPTVGLDVPSRHAIVEHVHNLCKETNLAVLWATHLIDEIYPDDKLIVLHQGAIQASGGVDAVCQQAAVDNIGDAFDRLTQKQVA